jgi:hypothetical protein
MPAGLSVMKLQNRYGYMYFIVDYTVLDIFASLIKMEGIMCVFGSVCFVHHLNNYY